MTGIDNFQISTNTMPLVPPGFKQTEVGVIPEDWELKNLGDLGKVVRGGSPRPAGDPRYFNGDFIPWLTVAALTKISEYQLNVKQTVGCLTEEGSKLSRTLPEETLIIANSGATLGVVKILGITCCANDGIAAIIDQRHGDKTFVCYFVNTQTQRLREVIATGNGQPNLNTKLIREISIPFPPLPEQRAIAAALSDVDALLEGLDRLIAKKRDLKQATMQQLLTGKTRLPGFEGEWEKTELGQFVTFFSGGTPSRSNESYWNGGIPWISATTLRTFYIYRSESNVTKEAVAAGSTMAPINATLLLVRGSSLHKEILAGLVTKPVCFNQDVKALLPNTTVLPEFLTFLLHGKSNDLLKLVSSAGNTAGVLDTKILKAFEVLLPAREEQEAISTVLSDIDTEIAALEQRRAKTKDLKQGMMQELLTGRTRLV